MNTNPYYTDPQSNNIVYGQPVYQGQPPGTTTYQIQPPAVIAVNVPGLYVQNPTFPNCIVCNKTTGTTLIPRYNGSLMWIMVAVFFFFTGCLCFIPCCIDQWKDK
jgi:hypothetical protein